MHIPPKKAEESERNLRELPDISHIRRWKWQRPPPPLRIRIHAPSKLDRRSDSLIDRFASHEWNTIYITEKKSQSWKRCPYLFFLIFCLGCLNSMKEQFLLWNNVKGGETMILLTSSPGWSLRGDPKRPPASVAKPQTPDVTVSRDVDGRDVGRTVDASEALGSRNQWRTGGKRCKMMAKYDAKDGNSSITWFQLRHLFWLVLWRMLHWDFSLARLRLVNWDDRKKSTRDLQVKETLFAKWKKTGRNRYEFDMNHIYIYE